MPYAKVAKVNHVDSEFGKIKDEIHKCNENLRRVRLDSLYFIIEA